MEFVLSGVDVIKGQKILDNIDLEIEKGSIFVLIGPSGSGKRKLDIDYIDHGAIRPLY